jgi:hypothetical protein
MAAGYLQYLVAPAFLLGLVGWIAFIAWTVVTSVGILRGESRPSPVLAAQPA